jgi:hypothetical protein
MDSPLIIRGTFSNKTFVPTDPLPEAEGPAELLVYVDILKEASSERPSIFDVFGKAKRLRSAAELDAQLEEERASWGDE